MPTNPKDPAALAWLDALNKALRGSPQAALDLIAAGGQAFGRCVDAGGATALCRAAARGRADCVAALLPWSSAADLDPQGRSALHFAAQKGSAACVLALLPFSDARLQDEEGLTPLMLAAEGLHERAIEALAPRSDLRLRDDENRDALAIARASPRGPSHPNRRRKCVRALLSARSRASPSDAAIAGESAPLAAQRELVAGLSTAGTAQATQRPPPIAVDAPLRSAQAPDLRLSQCNPDERSLCVDQRPCLLARSTCG